MTHDGAGPGGGHSHTATAEQISLDESKGGGPCNFFPIPWRDRAITKRPFFEKLIEYRHRASVPVRIVCVRERCTITALELGGLEKRDTIHISRTLFNR